MPRTTPPHFRKNLLALAAVTALTPTATWALELVQEPPMPTSKSTFVPPNVIISVDDSGSMDYCSNTESETKCVQNINNSNRSSTIIYSCESGYTLKSNNCEKINNPNKGTKDNSKRISTTTYSCPSGFGLNGDTNDCYTWGGATEGTAPVNGAWPVTSRRINVLKYSLNKVFSDPKLITENKIRLAWQVMWNNGGSPNAKSVNSTAMNTNSMRSIDAEVGTGKNKTTHRANFIDFVSKLSATNGTPSHLMFSQADDYMRQPVKNNRNSAWSTVPGASDDKAIEYLGCRRNYHIMMTDGRWSGTPTGGQQDGNNWDASGKRKAYAINSKQTQIYSDTEESTLADWAFKSWMEPLQKASDLKDAANINPSKEYEDADNIENITVKIGTVTKSVDLEKYWNPKYNPATWPHMVTYTVGFSNSAIEWPGAPTIKPPTLTPPVSETDKGGYFGYDKGFADLVTGWEKWPSMNISKIGNETVGTEVRSLDLWHAAINGRGRFYPVTKGEELENAFRAIIGKINEESAPLPDKITAGGSSSGYNISQNNAGLFASVYNAKKGWSGYITATAAREPEEYACPTKDDAAAKCFRFPDPTKEWDGKTTAERLDEPTAVDNRLILTWSDKWATNKATGGVAFKWATDDSKLSTAQKTLLGVETNATGATVVTRGENVLNFIRGDRSLEGAGADKPFDSAKPFRMRSSRQGDIVNSEIWYTGGPISSLTQDGYTGFAKTHKDRLPILYVGGNDGMLHGFSTKDGKEQIAYVPRGVITDLKKLADPNYTHQYYVDGSPLTGDVKDGNTWKTLLVGTLGGGGKGYFVLDVTSPSSFATATAASLVSLDRTRHSSETASSCNALTGAEKTACTAAFAEDSDIGNITAQPMRNPSNLQEATQITRMNNSRWAVVLGNGYNSTNQRPVLLVQYLDGDKALKRIQATTDTTDAGNSKDNGLATPALVDLDGDGKTDVVYAGDNLGNLWKFDLTSATDSNWAVAFGYNKPLFTARGPATLTSATRDQVQPITAPPIVRANDRSMTIGTGKDATTVAVGGVMVAFGTGRNLTSEDRRTDTTQNIQTMYSVLDNTRYRKNTAKTNLEVHPGTGDCGSKPATCVPTPAPVGTMANDGKPLAKQTVITVSGDLATVNATQELKKDTWKDYKGWYTDLSNKGERLLRPMQFYDGSNILAFYTDSPSGTKSSTSDNINESCVPVKIDTSAGSMWRHFQNIMDGKVPTVQLNPVSLSTITPVPTGTPILITAPPTTTTGSPTTPKIIDRTGGGSEVLNRMPEQSTRPSWRQLQ